MKQNNDLKSATVFVAVFGMTSPLLAADAVWTGSSGDLSAQAVFSQAGGDLFVTLTNDSLNDALVPIDVLTSLFFDLASDPGLTAGSAYLGATSSVLFGAAEPDGNVGGEWALGQDLLGAPGNAAFGVSSSGLDLFGPHEVFPGDNLDGPASPGGISYGITSAGDIPATGNAAVTGDNPLIQNEVVFNLGFVGLDFDPMANVGNVWFQYGTDFDEGPSFPGIPEPTTVILLCAGMALALPRRRR